MRATRTERVRQVARELLTEQHRRASEEIARLNAAGYLTSKQVAVERKVTDSAVSQWIARGLLEAERRVIEGEPHQLVRREELDRFNAEDWPRIRERMGPGYPANWRGDARRRWKNRRNGLKGHRPRAYTDLQAKAVRELHRGERLGYKRISKRTGLTIQQIRSILATQDA